MWGVDFFFLFVKWTKYSKLELSLFNCQFPNLKIVIYV